MVPPGFGMEDDPSVMNPDVVPGSYISTVGGVSSYTQAVSGVVNTDTILYRRLYPERATIYYMPGYSDSAPENYSGSYSWDPNGYQLLQNQFSRAGYDFAGWNAIDPDTYHVDASGNVTYELVKGEDGKPVLYPDRAIVDINDMQNNIVSSTTYIGRFVATWEPATYTITYNLDRGRWGANAGPESYRTVDIPANGLSIPRPERPGYVFDGWESLIISGDPALNAVIPPGTYGNLSFTAKWVLQQYTITCDLAGGRFPANASVPPGYNTESAPITLPVPIRDGYDFLGWSGGFLGSTQSVYVTIPAGMIGDQRFVAHWSAHRYSITYTLNGGTLDRETQYVKDDYVVTDPDYTLPTPTRLGYEFRGWSEQATPNSMSLTMTVPKGSTGSLHFIANWRSSNFKLTFEIAPGSWPSGYTPPTSYLPTSDPIVIPPLPDIEDSRGKYKFVGWTQTEGGTLEGQPVKTFTIPRGSVGNRAYKAVFAGVQTNIGFVASLPAGVSVEDGTAYIKDGALNDVVIAEDAFETAHITLPGQDALSARHYILRGWGASADALAQERPILQLTKSPTIRDIIAIGATPDAEGRYTLYAQWESAERAINYHLFGTGAVLNDAAPKTFYAGEATSLANAVPVWSGEGYKYNFAGWYTTPNYLAEDGTTETKVTEISADTTASIDLYARWDYEVAFDKNLASDVTVTGLPDTMRVTWIPTIASLSAEGIDTDGVDIDAMYKKWIGDSRAPKRNSATLTAPGYEFAGSYNTKYDGTGEGFAPGDAIAKGASTPSSTGSLVLYVQWSANSVSVNYMSDVTGDKTGIEGASPTDSYIKTYDADGNVEWIKVDATSTDPKAPGLPVADSLPGIQNITYGQSWTVSSKVPARTLGVDGEGNNIASGWRFDHWEATSEDGSTITLAAGASTSAKLEGWTSSSKTGALVAVWKFSAYAGYLDGNGGSARSGYAGQFTLFPADGATTITLPAGAKNPAAPEVLELPYTRDGFKFAGWEWTDADGNAQSCVWDTKTNAWATGANPVVDLVDAGSITFKARWEAIPYLIKFHTNTSEWDPTLNNGAGGYKDTSIVMETIKTQIDSTTPLTIPHQREDIKNQGLTLVGWGPDKTGNGVRFVCDDQISFVDMLADMKGAGMSDSEIWSEDENGNRVVNLYGHWSAVLNFEVPTEILFLIDPSTKEAFPVEGSIKSYTAGELEVVGLQADSVKAGFEQFFDNVMAVMLENTKISVTDKNDNVSVTVPMDSNTYYRPNPLDGNFEVPAGSPTNAAVLPLTYGLTLDERLSIQEIKKVYQNIEIGALHYELALKADLLRPGTGNGSGAGSGAGS